MNQNSDIDLVAKELFDKALELFKEGQYEESIKLYNILYEVSPDNTILNYNLCCNYYQLKDYEKALEYCLKADCSPSVLYDLGLIYFNLGQLKEGLKYYKYRYHKEDLFPILPLPFIEDSFEAYIGKNVLVLAEQGHGDEISFCRYIETLCSLAKTVHYQVYPNMLELFKTAFGYIKNLTFFTDKNLNRNFVNTFDVYTTTGNIFTQGILENRNKNNIILPEKEPLFKKTDKYKIGFVHEANPYSGNANKRNVDIKVFLELQNLNPDIDFYLLDFARSEVGFINCNEYINDFLDLAYLVNEMDEIITIDTALAHLSLTLGKETIIMFDDYLDWRWKVNLYTDPTPRFSKVSWV